VDGEGKSAAAVARCPRMATGLSKLVIGLMTVVSCQQAAPPPVPAPAPDSGMASPVAHVPAPHPALEGLRWSGSSEGVWLGWNDKRLEAWVDGRMTLRDAYDPAESEGCTEVVRSTEVLSWVGPYLSLLQSGGADCGGAHPVCSEHSETYDVRRGVQVDITDVFPESEVLAALRKDTYLRDTYLTPLSKALGVELASLDFEALSGKLMMAGGVRLTRTGFYFHHVEGGRVAVRVMLFPMAHAVCGEKVELGLSLEIPSALRGAMEAAQAGRAGFLGRDRPAQASYRDGTLAR